MHLNHGAKNDQLQLLELFAYLFVVVCSGNKYSESAVFSVTLGNTVLLL